MRFSIKGAGAIGPGYSDWADFRSVLEQGLSASTETPPPNPETISRRERARAPYLVKLAIAVAEQATLMSGFRPDEMASVFYSCMSDTEVTDYMCRTLAADPSEMSPTKFHNSVHNAAAGYWTISNKVQMPANAISANGHCSAGMALMESITQSVQERIPVLLVMYDVIVPPVLRCVLDIQQTSAFAMVICPGDEPDALRKFDTQVANEGAEINDRSRMPGLVEMSNPVFGIAPLFAVLAGKDANALSFKLGQDTRLILNPL